MERDYKFLIELPKLGDDILVGVEEVAAITGYCVRTIRHRRIKGFPAPLPGCRFLKWQLGQIRQWIKDSIVEGPAAKISSWPKPSQHLPSKDAR